MSALWDQTCSQQVFNMTPHLRNESEHSLVLRAHQRCSWQDNIWHDISQLKQAELSRTLNLIRCCGIVSKKKGEKNWFEYKQSVSNIVVQILSENTEWEEVFPLVKVCSWTVWECISVTHRHRQPQLFRFMELTSNNIINESCKRNLHVHSYQRGFLNCGAECGCGWQNSSSLDIGNCQRAHWS